jgi:hypothetical protein
MRSLLRRIRALVEMLTAKALSLKGGSERPPTG